MTGVVEGHSNRLEEVEKEHSIRTRELREQNLELAARVETLKDALDGERGQRKSCEPTGLANGPSALPTSSHLTFLLSQWNFFSCTV